LGEGIEAEDSDGQIEDLARFVSENTVVTVVEESCEDKNFEPLQRNLARLRAMKIGDDKIDIIILPMPKKIVREGQRLPASYANFYIANSCVLLPTFADPNDEIALSILQKFFPDRRVIGIGRVLRASNVTTTRSWPRSTFTLFTPLTFLSGVRSLRTHSSQSSPSVAISIVSNIA